MRHIAQEGRCFVLSCNQFARRRDYPDDYPTDFGDDPDTVMSRGAAASSARWARSSPGRTTTDEAILTAELDLGEIARARLDFDVVGHYARPDVFQLVVDETRRVPVTFRTSPAMATPPDFADSHEAESGERQTAGA